MNKDEIFQNSNGVSFKIINGEKWAIHKETQEPVMLLSEYKKKLLVFIIYIFIEVKMDKLMTHHQ